MHSIDEYKTALELVQAALDQVEAYYFERSNSQPDEDVSGFYKRAEQRRDADPRWQELQAIKTQLLDASIDAIKLKWGLLARVA